MELLHDVVKEVATVSDSDIVQPKFPDDAVNLLSQWYKKDENAVPAVYILQPISSILPNFNNKVIHFVHLQYIAQTSPKNVFSYAVLPIFIWLTFTVKRKTPWSVWCMLMRKKVMKECSFCEMKFSRPSVYRTEVMCHVHVYLVGKD